VAEAGQMAPGGAGGVLVGDPDRRQAGPGRLVDHDGGHAPGDREREQRVVLRDRVDDDPVDHRRRERRRAAVRHQQQAETLLLGGGADAGDDRRRREILERVREPGVAHEADRPGAPAAQPARERVRAGIAEVARAPEDPLAQGG
jgi:hypothetical protein